MRIEKLEQKDKARWSAFVVTNFPPVGAFLQSYEWGDFKSALHGTVLRFAIIEENQARGVGKNTKEHVKEEWVACFQLEIHKLPFGLSYGYSPRGPVLREDVYGDEKKMQEIFTIFAEYMKKEFPQLLFIRIEPPLTALPTAFAEKPYTVPSYYLQPRFNQLVTILPSDELLATFSSDIKHDIRAAGRLGVTVEAMTELPEHHRKSFEEMKNDTRARSGKSIFPSQEYFTHLEKNFKKSKQNTNEEPYICYFMAINTEGKAVAINMNILYGKTLTYLYGASYSGSISKRAPGYLHWKTMEFARNNNFEYYDLGGVDQNMWNGLTYFKRQFGGQTLEYMGNADLVIRPQLYRIYNNMKSSEAIQKVRYTLDKLRG